MTWLILLSLVQLLSFLEELNWVVAFICTVVFPLPVETNRKKKEIVSFICYEASAFSVSFELLCCEQMHSAGGAPAKPGQLSGM